MEDADAAISGSQPPHVEGAVVAACAVPTQTVNGAADESHFLMHTCQTVDLPKIAPI